MPLDLKKAKAKRCPLEVPFDDEKIKIVYLPRVMTPGRRKELIDNQDDPEYVFQFIKDIVAEWDITDEKGKPLPITPKAMKDEQIPDEVLNAIIFGILRDMSPNQNVTEGGGSF